MLINQSTSWRGLITVQVLDTSGELVSSLTFPNLITNAAKNMLRDALVGDPVDGRIRYVALGASSVAPSATQTQLSDERFRKQVTVVSTGTSPGEANTTLYVAPGEGNDFEINEIGWFAGPDATSSVNSGTMIARVLYNRQKVSSEAIQIERLDTIGGV